MKIYKLTWYLELEDCMKIKLITKREVAEAEYEELKKSLYKGCWLSLMELVENDRCQLEEGDGIRYNDI